MFTITVGSKEHAQAVVEYAAEKGCEDAIAEYDDLRKWHHVVVYGTTDQRRLLMAFVDGLEWMEIRG